MLYNLGLVLGLSIRDIDMMTAGELVDLSYYRVNQEEKRKEKPKEEIPNATQADYDAF